jgi:hypothetical protein
MWFLVENLLIPLLIAGILFAARKDARRVIFALSVGSLVLALAATLIFAFEFTSMGVDAAFLVRGFDGPLRNSSVKVLTTFEPWRNGILNIALLLGIAAWLMSLYDTIQTRRWCWFTTILLSACLSYMLAAIAISRDFMIEDPRYASLVRSNIAGSAVALNVLPHIVALVTLIYGLTAPGAQAAAHLLPSSTDVVSASNAIPPSMPS